MTKYQQIFQEMTEKHSALFKSFSRIHDAYSVDPDTWKDAFNEKGAQVMEVIRKYENILCSRSEGGGYGKYSGNLAEKFWGAIRLVYPKIDYIGVK
jgi:hypothetical protein